MVFGEMKSVSFVPSKKQQKWIAIDFDGDFDQIRTMKTCRKEKYRFQRWWHSRYLCIEYMKYCQFYNQWKFIWCIIKWIDIVYGRNSEIKHFACGGLFPMEKNSKIKHKQNVLRESLLRISYTVYDTQKWYRPDTLYWKWTVSCLSMQSTKEEWVTRTKSTRNRPRNVSWKQTFYKLGPIYSI